MKWITFSHWRLLKAGYDSHDMGLYVNVSMHSWLTKWCVSSFLYFWNSQTVWDEMIETSVSHLSWPCYDLPTEKELCCAVVVTATGSWCLARPCSTGQGVPLVLPSHPLCAGLWSFSFSDSIYQPSSHPLRSPEQWQPDTFCVFTLWSNLHPVASVQAVQLGSPVVEWRWCDTMMMMWNSNPTGGTASVWKTSTEPNWSPCEWCLYLCLLCQKSRGNT